MSPSHLTGVNTSTKPDRIILRLTDYLDHIEITAVRAHRPGCVEAVMA